MEKTKPWIFSTCQQPTSPTHAFLISFSHRNIRLTIKIYTLIKEIRGDRKIVLREQHMCSWIFFLQVLWRNFFTLQNAFILQYLLQYDSVLEVLQHPRQKSDEGLRRCLSVQSRKEKSEKKNLNLKQMLSIYSNQPEGY